MTGRREILIDAFNVIFAHPELGPLVRRDAERAREAFLALVAQLVPADGRRIWVVFDAHRDPGPATTTGRSGAHYTHGVHAVFARETADTWIRERIRAAADAGHITVVTSDREILDTARAHGAAILRVSEFLQLGRRRAQRARDVHSTEKPTHTSDREIAEWERLFGDRPPEES